MRRLQGPVTESLRVAFTSFRKFDDLVRDGVAERIDPPSLLQRYNGHRKRDAHEANRLGVEPVAFEILPDRHGGWLASSSARGQRYTLPSHARPFPVLPIILYKKNRAVRWRQATLGAPRGQAGGCDAGVHPKVASADMMPRNNSSSARLSSGGPHVDSSLGRDRGGPGSERQARAFPNTSIFHSPLNV